MVESNIPDYYPFNSYTLGFKKLNLNIDKIVSVISKVRLLVDSFEKQTVALSEKERLLSSILEFTKNSMETEIENIKDKKTIFIQEDIKDIKDLINIIDIYRDNNNNFSIKMDVLRDLYTPLKKLKDTIGMEDVKSQIVDQIVSSVQDLYDEEQMFHTVIQGPPGVGKTMLAHIIGDIYSKLGIINNKKFVFKIATRSDLIGKYLGHTAKLTQDFIDSCKGGVMFIDEVYSLGNSEKRDSYSKECIDTINLNLTKNNNFVCIIAGYPEDIENCFFSYNQGLQRRFPFRYTINSYTPKELKDIFILKVDKMGWRIDIKEDALTEFFNENIDCFKYFGGDIQNLITNIKTVHGRRIFGKDIEIKLINTEDLFKGFEKYLSFKNKENNFYIHSMYT